jgi:hypothetical protein
LFRADLKLPADEVLAECLRRGLMIRNQRELAGKPGSRHWHLRRIGGPGTLELNDWNGVVWVTVHPLRDGGWARDFARDLGAVEAARTRTAK